MLKRPRITRAAGGDLNPESPAHALPTQSQKDAGGGSLPPTPPHSRAGTAKPHPLRKKDSQMLPALTHAACLSEDHKVHEEGRQAHRVHST